MPFPLVLIDASAGGLEASVEILRALPPHTGLSVVPITHLSSDQKSQLAEILGRQTALNIDQLHSVRDELRSAQNYALSVIESLEVPIAVLTHGLEIRTVNTAFCRLAGVSSQDLQQRPFPHLAALLWGMESVRAELDRLRQAGQPVSFKLEHETTGAESQVLLVRGQMLQTEDEPVILISVENVTEQRKAEKLLASANVNGAGHSESTTQELVRGQNELRMLTASLFQSHEEERRQIARELHDDVSQQLAILDMELDELLAHSGQTGHFADRVQTVRDRAAALSQDVRRISHRLHPAMLEDLGLGQALRALVEEFGTNESMPASFRSRSVPDPVPPEVAGALYRIAEEALQNIVKHAGKTHVKALLEGRSQRLRLEIADFGEGFDLEEVQKGVGLIGMEERARSVGGTLTVSASLGKGTSIVVDIPMPNPHI